MFLFLSSLAEVPASEIKEEIPPPTLPASYNGETTYHVSCYPYESAEVGDLTFGAGEYITVIKKDGDWWTGTIGTRTGIFPSNYVQDISSNETAPPPVEPISSYSVNTAIKTKETTSPLQNYADDDRNQEEADTEVSEINTQPKTENVQETYSRPMSTSSTTSVRKISILCFRKERKLHFY